MSLNPRRPRPAFAPLHAPLLLRQPCVRSLSRRLPRWTCATATSTSLSEGAPDSSRTQVVQQHLETTRNRVTRLNSRVVVRAGEAGIKLGEEFLAGVQQDEASEAGIIGRLRKELRGLKRLYIERGIDEQAKRVVEELERVVEMASDTVARKRVTVGGLAHEEVQDMLVGRGEILEDLEWAGEVGEKERERGEFVDVVRRTVVEKRDMLKRRASSVGAGIEEKFSEFLKEDGSIDVDGLKVVVGKILDNVGMTWKRLNGWVPKEEPDGQALVVRDKEKEFELREEIGILEGKLSAASKEREAALRREDQLGKLIRAKAIRLMDDKVSSLRRTLAVRVLQLEMEKIFVSVAEEIENCDAYAMMEQRVLVVEFGELDERLAALQVFVEQDEPLLIDDDVLGALAADVQDLKTRLGLGEPLYSSATISWAQMQQSLVSTARKARAGFEFYSRGLRLFAGDLRFAIRLIRRTIIGYTPSPREIRTLRRTGRDLLTLIPFTIVLIAPLTPIGHVLIFSFLQRYWPEFFPSTFSERRQELMKRHEQYALSLREEGSEEDEVEDEDADANRGSAKGLGSRLSVLRKLLFWGPHANETGEDNSKEDNGTSRTYSGDRTLVSGNGKAIGNGKGEQDLMGNDLEGEEGARALNELAQGARNGEKTVRKRKGVMAADELHLAD